MERNIKALDCEGHEITVGSTVDGAMSEVLIMGICGEVEEIKFDNRNEPWGRIKGYPDWWHLRQFMILK